MKDAEERPGGELVDRHPFAKIGIFLSYLQPSGEAIEQREYIESSRLFFSLGSHIQLIEDKSANLKMAVMNLVS